VVACRGGQRDERRRVSPWSIVRAIDLRVAVTSIRANDPARPTVMAIVSRCVRRS